MCYLGDYVGAITYHLLAFWSATLLENMSRAEIFLLLKAEPEFLKSEYRDGSHSLGNCS